MTAPARRRRRGPLNACRQAWKAVDAHGQSLAYFYARENDNDVGVAGVLTMDQPRRLAINFVKLPELLGRG